MTSGIRKKILATAMVSVMAFGSMGLARDAHALNIDLGFMLDESGSVGLDNYDIAGDALAAALDLIPLEGDTANTYTIGVVSFGTNVQTLVPPTVLSAASIAGIKSAITSDVYSGGWTNMGGALDQIRNDFINAGGLGDLSLLNMTTDGVPCSSGSNCGNAHIPAIAAATATSVAGWDGLSFEAIGDISTATILSMAYPFAPDPAVLVTNATLLPNPVDQGFVLKVADFGNYADAITAKVQLIVDEAPPPVPLPPALPLFAAGLGIMGFFGWRRKRKNIAVA